ncbi:MAG: phage major tail tube protein [Ruminococcus sp.]
MDIPSFINNFNMYDAKNAKEEKLVGITDTVNLPDFKTITASVSGAGIPGSIDMPVVGQFEAMPMDIPFRTISKNMLNFVKGGTCALRLRGAIQESDDSTGQIKASRMVVGIKGTVTKIAPGEVKVANGTNSSVGIEVTYIKISIDGKDVIELNKLTGLFRINGEDAYADFSKYM